MDSITYCSQDISELAKAMIAVQSELPPVSKDSFNPFTKSRFASLPQVLESCRTILLKHDIWLTQFPVTAPEGHLGLVTKLIHAPTGQYQASLAIVPLPKADPQGFGIACTYTRRYAISSLLGLIIDDDEDGEIRQNHELSKSSFNSQKEENKEKLPECEGVTYETTFDKNNNKVIIARGNTYKHRGELTSNGFRWSATDKVYRKYAA